MSMPLYRGYWKTLRRSCRALRLLLAQLKLELDHLDMRIDEADGVIKNTAGENEACQRLIAIPGIGPLTATAVIAAIGNGAAYKPFEQFDAGEWQRILHVNLIGVFEVTRQVLPVMRRAGRGWIVNMGSFADKEGLPSFAAYSAASAGVIAFTKALSREVCDTGIRVNCVAPGPVDTDLI